MSKKALMGGAGGGGAAPLQIETLLKTDDISVTGTNNDFYQNNAIDTSWDGVYIDTHPVENKTGSGKYYYEIEVDGSVNATALNYIIGGIAGTQRLHFGFTGYPGSFSDSVGWQTGLKARYVSGGGFTSSGTGTLPTTSITDAAGDFMGVAYEQSTGKVWFCNNGDWGNGDPALGTNEHANMLTANEYISPVVAQRGYASGPSSLKVNLYEDDMIGTPPTGFTQWPERDKEYGYDVDSIRSDPNLTITNFEVKWGSGGWDTAYLNRAAERTNGHYYFEVKLTQVGDQGHIGLGWAINKGIDSFANIPGSNGGAFRYILSGQRMIAGSGNTGLWTETYVNGDSVGLEFNMNTKTITIYGRLGTVVDTSSGHASMWDQDTFRVIPFVSLFTTSTNVVEFVLDSASMVHDIPSGAASFDGVVGVTFADFTYTGNSLSFGTKDNTGFGCGLSNSGTRLFFIGSQNDKIYQANLPTANSVSGASITSNEVDLGTLSITNPRGFKVSNDGSTIWVMENSSRVVHQWTMSSAGDLSTASKDAATTSFDISGTHGFYIADNLIDVYSFTQATQQIQAWYLEVTGDITSMTKDIGNVYTSDPETDSTLDLQSLVISSDRTRLYTLHHDYNALGKAFVYEHKMSVAGDLTTATYLGKKIDVSTESVTPAGLAISEDGGTLIVLGNTPTTAFFEYKL